MEDDLFTGCAASGIKAVRSWSGLSSGTWEPVAPMIREKFRLPYLTELVVTPFPTFQGHLLAVERSSGGLLPGRLSPTR